MEENSWISFIYVIFYRNGDGKTESFFVNISTNETNITREKDRKRQRKTERERETDSEERERESWSVSKRVNKNQIASKLVGGVIFTPYYTPVGGSRFSPKFSAENAFKPWISCNDVKILKGCGFETCRELQERISPHWDVYLWWM